MEKGGGELDLPGFRFHPTEEELLDFYLRRMVNGKRLSIDIIATVNLYRHDPWDLPVLAKIGEREWYFFVPRDRKQANGGRPNRTTARGFWKATGSDRPIRSAADPKRLIGLKKTLVFYRGRAPRGTKTDWVMNEYRLPDATPPPKEDIVLCKVYRKATSLKELEQRAAIEASRRTLQGCCNPTPASIAETAASSSKILSADEEQEKEMKQLLQREVEESSSSLPSLPSINLPEVQIPRNTLEDAFDWMQDPFLTQLHSPWLDPWSPYPNSLNF